MIVLTIYLTYILRLGWDIFNAQYRVYGGDKNG